MTTINEAREAIYQRFTDNYSTTPFMFDREIFEAPKNADWVRLAVRHRFGGQETLGPDGGRKFRRRGTVVAQVFTPINVGQKSADEISQEILGIYEAVSFSGLDFNDGTIRESPPEDDWNILLVEAFFEYEETK